MDKEIRAALRERGFKWAIVGVEDVSVLTVGAVITVFRVWARAEDEYLASINSTFSGVSPDRPVYAKQEL